MDIIIASKAKLFVSAIGVPPKEVIERLHKAGIVVMKYGLFVAYFTSKASLTLFNSMVGHPKVRERLASPRVR